MDGEVIAEIGHGDAPRDALDLGSLLLTPAFVDLQCNGVGDVDFATTDADGWSTHASPWQGTVSARSARPS